MIRAGTFALRGAAEGVAAVLTEPLSFWGGVDAATGAVIDRAHPALGTVLAGRVVVMPGGRGSSSSASVLAEAIRLGTGPVALVLSRPDPILTVGALVAAALYGLHCPIVTCPVDGIATGDRVRIIEEDGAARVEVTGRGTAA